MKAHIREEDNTDTLNLGEGTLFTKKDGENIIRSATRQNIMKRIPTMKLSRPLYLKKI